jgi:hypothetical protein
MLRSHSHAADVSVYRSVLGPLPWGLNPLFYTQIPPRRSLVETGFLACFLLHDMISFSLEARSPSPPPDPVYKFLQLVALKLSRLGNQ